VIIGKAELSSAIQGLNPSGGFPLETVQLAPQIRQKEASCEDLNSN